MNALVQQIYTRPSFGKLMQWCKLVTITGFSQIVVQGCGFLGGILVIRLLPTHEYALYTLANTMLGTMLVLADGGIANSVMAQGGKVWSDRRKLGVVMATGFNLRKRFAIASLLVVVPTLLFLLRHHNAAWLTSLLVIASLIPAFLSSLSGSLLAVGLLLHQTIGPFQKVQVSISLTRTLLLSLLLFIFPFAYIAVISAGLPQIWGNFRLKKLSQVYADLHQRPDPKIEKEILTVVKRVLPGSIYYCLSGQITIWIISFLGTTNSLAQIGALGRLSMILVIFSTIFSTLVTPRFARLESKRDLLLKRFCQIFTLLFVLLLLIMFVASLVPGPLLWILGKDYIGLESQLLLSVAGSCISVLAGLLFSISLSRNWALNPLISLPLTLGTIAFGAMFMDLSTLTGVLKFNILIASIEVLLYLCFNIIKILRVT
jgi:O-antigen/teichoic acid export membrane protein